jgi:hypothetical protein
MTFNIGPSILFIKLHEVSLSIQSSSATLIGMLQTIRRAHGSDADKEGGKREKGR